MNIEQPRDLLMWYLKHCKIWTSWKKQFVTKDFCRWFCPTNVTAPHILKKILPCHNGIKIIMYEKMTLSLDIVITFKVRDGMPPFYSERTIVHVKRWPRWRTVKVLNRRNIWMCVCWIATFCVPLSHFATPINLHILFKLLH